MFPTHIKGAFFDNLSPEVKSGLNLAPYFIFLSVLYISSLKIRRGSGVWIVFFIAFVFIGLRYETGFDWPVYKGMFERFSERFDASTVSYTVLEHQQEITFTIFMGILAQIFPTYEYVQAFFTAFFLFSFIFLGRSIASARIVLALAMYYSFYLFPVGFSTVRQTLAISFFNVGLAFILRGKRGPSYVGFILAIAMQTSAAVYVLAYFLGKLLLRRRRLPGPIAFSVASASFLVTLPVLLSYVASLVPLVARKIIFYQEYAFSYRAGLFLILLLFSIFVMGLSATSLRGRSDYLKENEVSVLRSLIVVLSAVAIGSFFFSVLRERVSYELVLLFCLYATTAAPKFRLGAIAFISAVGIFYQANTFLIYPNIIAFAPYQNAIVLTLTGEEGSGAERSAMFLEMFNELNR